MYITQCMPRERATALALIRDANISGRRRAGTGPAPSENDRTYLVVHASIRVGQGQYRETKTKSSRGDWLTGLFQQRQGFQNMEQEPSMWRTRRATASTKPFQYKITKSKLARLCNTNASWDFRIWLRMIMKHVPFHQSLWVKDFSSPFCPSRMKQQQFLRSDFYRVICLAILKLKGNI